MSGTFRGVGVWQRVFGAVAPDGVSIGAQKKARNLPGAALAFRAYPSCVKGRNLALDKRWNMGPVESAIRRSIRVGESLETPAQMKTFTVDTIDQSGVVLLFGQKQTPTLFTREALNMARLGVWVQLNQQCGVPYMWDRVSRLLQETSHSPLTRSMRME